MDGYVREYRSSAECALAVNGEEFLVVARRVLAGAGGMKTMQGHHKASQVGCLHKLCAAPAGPLVIRSALHWQHRQRDLDAAEDYGARLSDCSTLLFDIVPSTSSGRRLAA